MVDKLGRTALHICAANNDMVGLKRLLSSGAKTTIKDVNGNVPYELATDPKLKVELGGKLEEIKITRPVYTSIPPKNNKKLIRINPKKINVPPPGVPPMMPPVRPVLKTHQNGFTKPATVSFATLATSKPPATSLEVQSIPAPKPEKVSFLELPQDKKPALDSRSDDDSGSDSDR